MWGRFPDPNVELRRSGEPDQIAEQRGDELSFLSEGMGNDEPRPALVAELRSIRVPVPQEGHVTIAC